MTIEAVATEGPGELGYHALLEVMDPMVHHVIVAIFLITTVIVVFAVVDIIRRGRARVTTLALTRMLTALAPLLGLFAASDSIFDEALQAANANAAPPGIVAVAVANAGYVIWIGALCGCIGAVLTAVLRIESAWRAGRRPF